MQNKLMRKRRRHRQAEKENKGKKNMLINYRRVQKKNKMQIIYDFIGIFVLRKKKNQHQINYFCNDNKQKQFYSIR